MDTITLLKSILTISRDAGARWGAREAELATWEPAQADHARDCERGNFNVKLGGTPDRYSAAYAAEGRDGTEGAAEASALNALLTGRPDHETLRPVPGWTLRLLSGAPHTATYTARLEYKRITVAEWDVNAHMPGDGTTEWRRAGAVYVLPYDQMAAERAARKAKASAHHAAYIKDLVKARAAVAADPALRFTLEIAGFGDWRGWREGDALDAMLHGAEVARACLALAGWLHDEGQDGGVVWPPMCECPHSGLSLRGVLGLSRGAYLRAA